MPSYYLSSEGGSRRWVLKTCRQSHDIRTNPGQGLHRHRVTRPKKSWLRFNFFLTVTTLQTLPRNVSERKLNSLKQGFSAPFRERVEKGHSNPPFFPLHLLTRSQEDGFFFWFVTSEAKEDFMLLVNLEVVDSGNAGIKLVKILILFIFQDVSNRL